MNSLITKTSCFNYDYYFFKNRISGCNVAFTNQPDTVQTQDKKPCLLKSAKWWLGVLALVGIGTAAYILSKGKVGNKSVQQLSEQIEFKEAGTVGDAVKFAQENLGIKLDIGDNLFIANFINESCVNVSNAMRGKAYFPKRIEFGIVNNSKAAGGYDSISNVLVINNKNTGWGTDFYEAFNKTLKTKDSYLEYSKLLNLNKNTVFNDMRITIYHELGHCNHKAICKDFEKMDKLKELDNLAFSDKSITTEFLNDKTIQSTAAKVSKYSKDSPAEFVAEVFARRMQGQIFSDDIIALYKKYNGPPLPKFK